jgi:hypothetical protein
MVETRALPGLIAVTRANKGKMAHSGEGNGRTQEVKSGPEDVPLLRGAIRTDERARSDEEVNLKGRVDGG